MRMIDGDRPIEWLESIDKSRTLNLPDIKFIVNTIAGEMWRHVDDEPPRKSCTVIIFTEDRVTQVVEYSAQYKLFNAFDDMECPEEYAIKNVMHWMPLPDLP